MELTCKENKDEKKMQEKARLYRVTSNIVNHCKQYILRSYTTSYATSQNIISLKNNNVDIWCLFCKMISRCKDKYKQNNHKLQIYENNVRISR